jgi:hypothetical protein
MELLVSNDVARVSDDGACVDFFSVNRIVKISASKSLENSGEQ